jgi:hypothetical protein
MSWDDWFNQLKELALIYGATAEQIIERYDNKESYWKILYTKNVTIHDAYWNEEKE